MNLAGKTLGKYQIGPEIGRGGMGAVYKGYDPALNRAVAVKILAPHLTWERRFVDRFVQEARTVAQLNHPHIVSIHDVGVQDGVYYLVMAFVEGETLRDLIVRQGALPPRRAAEILAQVAQALDYAHQRGVVHRDVKPGNILMEAGQRVVLTDFGIAQAVEGPRLTATGMSLGTPEYMSPEQAMGEPTDARSDVYSLGIVLYEMLTGRVPFRADTPLAALRMQADSPPPSPRRYVRFPVPGSGGCGAQSAGQGSGSPLPQRRIAGPSTGRGDTGPVARRRTQGAAQGTGLDGRPPRPPGEGVAGQAGLAVADPGAGSRRPGRGRLCAPGGWEPSLKGSPRPLAQQRRRQPWRWRPATLSSSISSARPTA